MHCIKLTLAYDGTAYAGWQVQPERTTVQGVLEAAIKRVTGEASRTLASGRTDAGVHALGQVASFRTECELADEVLVRALNARLPHDVAVLDAARVADDFHPIRDARRKRYRYVIHDGPVREVFSRNYAWHVKQPLDDAAMHRAAQGLLGRHDFSSFENAGAPRLDSIRTVSDILVVRGSDCGTLKQGATAGLSSSECGTARENTIGQASSGTCNWQNRLPQGQGGAGQGGQNHFINVEVAADGFLYNMVRAIVGTLVEVGRGAEDEAWPGQVLAAKDRRQAGPTAPPQGLFLACVDYG